MALCDLVRRYRRHRVLQCIRDSLDVRRFQMVSTSLPYDVFIKKKSVCKTSRVLDRLIAKSTKRVINPKLVFICFYFTRRCVLDDYRTQVCQLFAKCLENNIIEAVTQIRKALPLRNRAALASCVARMWEVYEKWYEEQEKLNRMIKDAIRIFARTKRHFENSAVRCKAEGFNLCAANFDRGVQLITGCVNSFYAEITFEEFRVEAKRAEDEVIATYAMSEQPIEQPYDVDAEVVFANGLLWGIKQIKAGRDGGSVDGLIASFD